jgi:protein TonB
VVKPNDVVVKPDEFKGFKTLPPPPAIPTELPPPSVAPPINEADFTGEGVRGGSSKGKELPAGRVVSAEDVGAAPTFTPFTVAPQLTNRSAVASALQRNYPPLLRDSGVGGTVLVWFFIDQEGKVVKTQVKESSGHEALDQAALKVADVMRFTPAQNRDQKVAVWVALPVIFQTSK